VSIGFTNQAVGKDKSMSQNTLQRLAGHILISSQARQAMLTGDRDAVLRQFDLTNDERRILSQAHSNSIANLLAAIEALSQSHAVNETLPPAHDDSFLLNHRQLACR
jgi:hypothetical protein